MRCLIVARELRRVAPEIDSHFLISREAYFRDAIDFEVDYCDASPTLCTPRVIAVLERLHPNVVVFDNSGRTRQMAAARRVGAHLVFVSRTPRLRRKAFRFRWLQYLSEHWIAFPEFISGKTTLLERAKLGLFPQVQVRYLDTLLQPPDPALRHPLLHRLGFPDSAYVLFIPGSGGVHPDAMRAVAMFAEGARQFCAAGGAVGVVLTGSNTAVDVKREGHLYFVPRLHSDEVQHLIQGASIVVSNAGNSMLHTLTHGKAAVIVPMGNDQPSRVRKVAALGVALASPANSAAVAAAALRLYFDKDLQESLKNRLQALGMENGLKPAVEALVRLATASSTGLGS
jgi:UDP-N-acetylglucosamine transferase subunit ALG13